MVLYAILQKVNLFTQARRLRHCVEIGWGELEKYRLVHRTRNMELGLAYSVHKRYLSM